MKSSLRSPLNAGSGATPPLYLCVVVKRFLFIFLSLAALLAGIFALFYYEEAGNQRDIIEADVSNDIDHLVRIISDEFQLVVSDLMFLSEQNELQEMLLSGAAERLDAQATEYLSFSARKGIYDQIRFLDETGMEVVRINFNAGEPAIVPEDDLQPKGERYYFGDTFVLDKGEVFVSPLDLNIEQGQIEQPLKPMIRFGTPVFDGSGAKRGTVLLNFLAEHMLHYIEQGLYYGQLHLINSDGYWLNSPVAEDEWGFMFEDRSGRMFSNDHPEAWERMGGNQSGQFYDGNGLYTYSTVYPLLEGQWSSTGSPEPFQPSQEQIDTAEYYWTLVSYVPPDVMKTAAGIETDRYFQLYGILGVLLAGGSWAVAHTGVRRKQMGDVVRVSESRLTEAQRIACVGSWDLDITANRLWWSDEVYLMFGLAPQESPATYEAFLNAVHPDDRESVDRSFTSSVENDTPYDIVHRLVRPDGEVRWVREVAENSKDDTGRIVRSIGTVHDVTEIQEARLRSEEADHLKSVFLASMSHELRTPLNSIIGFTGVILQGMSGEVNDEQRKQLTMVKNSGRHLLSLINEVLDISKVEAGKVELEPEEFMLDALAAEVIESLSPAFAEKGLQLEVEIPGGIAVFSDRRRVKQVLMNLVSNAVKFTERGSVTVAGRLLGDGRVEIRVLDTGVGIKEDDIKRLFQPFQRAGAPLAKKQEGTGLGLYLSSKLANLLGGDIRAKSEYGRGSEFTFTVPLRYEEI